jgi:hypothetical protein
MAKKLTPFARLNPDSAATAPELAQADGQKLVRKSARKDKSKTTRLTLDLPPEVEFRLYNVARTVKMHKGAFAIRLIDQGLRSYKADATLKTTWAEICGQGGESVSDSTA